MKKICEITPKFKNTEYVLILISILGITYLFVANIINFLIYIIVFLLLIIYIFILLRFNYSYILTKKYFIKKTILKLVFVIKTDEIKFVQLVEYEKESIKSCYLRFWTKSKSNAIEIFSNKEEVLKLFCHFKKLGVKTEIDELYPDFNEFENEGEFEDEYDCEKILKD